jgi:hypothetical protein
MSDKVQKFLTTVMSHFNKRHASPEDEDAWTLSMINGLKPYDARVLDAAAQRIILTRDEPGFPYLADCRRACEEVIKLEKASQTPQFDDKAKAQARINDHDWRYKLADELIICPMGRQAAREGWALSLHNFIVDFGRLPNDHEINGRVTPTLKNRLPCKQAAEEFQKAFEGVLNGEAGPCSKMLEALADKMNQRREKIERMILEGGNGR